MKTCGRWIVAGVLLLVVVGCSLNQQFVDAVDEAWQVIGPRYVEYVQEDPRLDDQNEATRIRTAVMLSELIEEAQKDE